MKTKEKPVIFMTDAEKEQVFADLGRDGYAKDLACLRCNLPLPSPQQIAVLRVFIPEQGDVDLLWAMEFGDGEGLRFVASQKRSIQVAKLLLPGETLSIHLCFPAGFSDATITKEQRRAMKVYP